jgi:5-formyltetrahydrofolate cyclo-ligase
LLAFDLQGQRVGYGKGYYDKFLKTCRPDCAKIGLSLFDPEKEITSTTTLDVPLNLCITPARVFKFLVH